MKTKKSLIALVSVIIIFVLGAYAMIFTALNVPKTYDGSVSDVIGLYEDPDSYDASTAQGIAELIVMTNLDRTQAQNAVSAIVFDYRGFDTIGESFILLCAISGVHVILHTSKKKKEDEN